jgi:hypothetical protein
MVKGEGEGEGAWSEALSRNVPEGTQENRIININTECTMHSRQNILHTVTCRGVNTHGVWIGEWIYWPHMTRNHKQLQRHR